jgi:hypothetical protein
VAKQKMRLTLDLVIDTDNWYTMYGVDPLADNAQDVATYAVSLLRGSAAWDGAGIVSVEVR